MYENIKAPENLLSNFEDEVERAASGKRLANNMIDLIIFYIVIIGIIFILAFTNSSIVDKLDSAGFNLIDRLLSLLLFALFMGTIEAIKKGKSIGKYITGTRAVILDGSPIWAGTDFARGFSRAVPFCAFSALVMACNPWQDRRTDSLAIIEKTG